MSSQLSLGQTDGWYWGTYFLAWPMIQQLMILRQLSLSYINGSGLFIIVVVSSIFMQHGQRMWLAAWSRPTIGFSLINFSILSVHLWVTYSVKQMIMAIVPTSQMLVTQHCVVFCWSLCISFIHSLHCCKCCLFHHWFRCHVVVLVMVEAHFCLWCVPWAFS